MPGLPDLLSQAETGDLTRFFRLEASLVNAAVEQRPNSRSKNDVDRHAEKSDLAVNELDFNFDLDTDNYPLGNLRSLQQVFDAVQYEHHLKNDHNFSPDTRIQCLKVDLQGGEWETLDENGMQDLLQQYNLSSSAPSSSNSSTGRKMLVFLVPLVPAERTSFGSRALITRENTNSLMKLLNINPAFLLNLIGRPDYWAPQKHLEADDNGSLVACDLFCQHPCWNLHVKGPPTSVYMRHDITHNLTTYIISHKESDTCIKTLQSLLDTALHTAPKTQRSAVFLDDPFDIHVILSTLSFEASKYHVKRFQRFMWTQINKLDDYLAGIEASDPEKLGDLTKQLQIMSHNADSHTANADVAIITATAIRDAHFRFTSSLLHSSPFILQRVEDSICYIISSMEKQKIWFLNYKQRKDSTLSLVYNLVTQQDAANNIQISHSMKQDSTSMNAIAALTMVFLPGTFAGTVIGAGVFGGAIRERFCLIWAAMTIPLTLLVMLCWWLYQKSKNPMVYGTSILPGKEKPEPELDMKPRRFSTFSFRSKKTGQRNTSLKNINT